MSESTIVLLTLIGYKVLLILIGLWASSRNKTATDFFLAGRQMGSFVAGLSYAASTSSAWVLLGFSGFVYAIGISAVWMVPGVWAGYAAVWLYVGPKLQRESRQQQHITVTDFLLQDARGSSPAQVLKATAGIAACLILFCFVFYIAAQFDAAGKALVEHFPLTLGQAITLGAAIVLIYSLLGGFWAVSVTDTIQAIVMLLVSIGVPLATLHAAGGLSSTWATLNATMPTSYLALNGGHAWLIFIGFVVGTIGMSLGAIGQPHLLSRLMAIKGDKERRQGFFLVLSWGVVVFIGMIILGLSGRALLPSLPGGEALFYQAASAFLPPVLGGIVVAATLSAVMSTVDSILLAAAGAVAHDLGVTKRFPTAEVMASRLVMFFIAVLAVVLTLTLPDTIFNRVLFAWSALGAAFGPIIIWRVTGGTVSATAALSCMLVGFGTTVLFYTFGSLPASENLLSQAAWLPGDPFERAFPWIPALLVLWLMRR